MDGSRGRKDGGRNDDRRASALDRRGSLRKRARHTAGVVMVEYALLLVGFGVPVMLGTAAAGIHLIKAYGDIRNDMLGKGP
jgi:hypothetical protein